MTPHKTSRLIKVLLTATLLTLAATPALALQPNSNSAVEAKSIPAVSREVVEKQSQQVQNAATPAKAAAEQSGTAKVDKEGKATGGEAAAAKPVSDEEKKAAITEADSITQFDPALVRGMAHPWQKYFEPAASPVMEKIEALHNMVMIIITVVTIFVMGLIFYVCVRFRASRNPVPNRFAHNTTVEIAWTVIPILILVAIGIPSVRAHYQYTNNQDIIDHPDLTLKVVGHQWYWSYEYPDYGIGFDSNIVPEKDLKAGQPRLLTVDNPIVVPVGKVVRVQVTGADVIHSWAMPSMGVKQDTVPGKLSETWFKADKEGIYYGECSELCGKYHGFMPIELHVVSQEMFDAWVAGAKLKFASNDNLQLAQLSR